MRSLYVYGCSWSHSERHTNCGIILWPDLINEKLNCNLINNASSGRSNIFSFRKLISDISKFKKDDIIIFQFSYGHRLELPFIQNNDYWSSININRGDKIFDINNITEEKLSKYIDFILHYNLELLLNDFDTIKKIFDHLKENIGVTIKYWFIDIGRFVEYDFLKKRLFDKDMSVIFWSKLYNGLDASMLMELEKCRIEDDEHPIFENDNHPNKKGQELIADFILKSLIKNII